VRRFTRSLPSTHVNEGGLLPFVQITMLEGRTIGLKHDLIKGLTDATAEALGGDPARIRVG
jgi:phenylpyruvate tautomerase PptA (4-oxalocrotonate tautomerase family)